MSAPAADCLFCRIMAGELPADVVAESDRTFAFRDINPQAPTHVLVVPREHYADPAAMCAVEPDLATALVAAGVTIAEREGLAESGYRLLFNSGPHAGQMVFHVHLHVLGGEPLGGMVGGGVKSPGQTG